MSPRRLPRSHPLRVVIVEDSPLIRDRIADAPSDIPNLVISGCAETQDEAPALLRARAWDAVLLDLQLREGSGIAVLEQLAALGRLDTATTIVFTNYNFPQYRSRMLDLGADFFRQIARVSSCTRSARRVGGTHGLTR